MTPRPATVCFDPRRPAVRAGAEPPPAGEPAEPGIRAAEPGTGAAEPGVRAAAPAARAAEPATRAGVPEPDRSPAWTADEAVTRLYAAHYRPLVRLAVLLLDDRGRAEEIVQDAFVALHARWRRLREADKALGYLRTSVVNRSRSALRHRRVVDRHLAAAAPLPDAPSAEAGALGALDHAAVVAALHRLPTRQREALVLRYYGDLPVAEIAALMGISRGAVKSHTSRGLAALRLTLERRS